MTHRSDLLAIVSQAQQTPFVPTGRQIRVRNQFWAGRAGAPLPDSELATVLKCGAPESISRYWTTPGFADWFTSPEWEKEESHRLLIEAMHRVSGVLRDETDSGRILSAAKEAREIYTRLNQGGEKEKYMDEDIATMDKLQLEEYIRRASPAAVSR